MKTILRFLFICCLFPPIVTRADESQSTLKIGSILILTGEGSSWGNASRNGIDLAIEKINAGGGVLGKNLVAVHQDDRGDPKSSISAFKELTARNVKFIIGPTWSNLGLPLIERADAAKVIMISPSLGVAAFNEESRFLFNTWPHDALLSEQLADYVYKKGHRNVALVGAEHVWVKEQTHAFKQRFEALGGKIGFLTEPNPGSTDLRADATKIKSLASIDAVVSTTDGIVIGSLVAKALKELKATLPFYSITLDQAAIDVSQGGFEGLEFLTFLTPKDDFKSEYEKRFNTTIDIGADSAYDAVMMLAQALEESGKEDPEAVAESLAAIETYEGASGMLRSDGRRGYMKPFSVMKVRDGKASRISQGEET